MLPFDHLMCKYFYNTWLTRILFSVFPKCEENPCFTQCINLVPGYRCTGCPPGFLGNAPGGFGVEYARTNKQNCTDINECAQKDDSGCDENSFCINTQVPSFLFFMAENSRKCIFFIRTPKPKETCTKCNANA